LHGEVEVKKGEHKKPKTSLHKRSGGGRSKGFHRSIVAAPTKNFGGGRRGFKDGGRKTAIKRAEPNGHPWEDRRRRTEKKKTACSRVRGPSEGGDRTKHLGL